MNAAQNSVMRLLIKSSMRSISILLVFLVVGCLSETCKDGKPAVNRITCAQRFSGLHDKVADYVLPFPPGKKYVLSQTCCNPDGGHSNQLAYDFALYFGDTVCCMRSGIVRALRGDQPDNGGDINGSGHNYLMIQHDDSTVAFYAHLKKDGILVGYGDYIEQGENIALSGNSGNTLNFPHLHVGVYEGFPPAETFDLPIFFKNIDGPVDNQGRLIADSWYTALSY